MAAAAAASEARAAVVREAALQAVEPSLRATTPAAVKQQGLARAAAMRKAAEARAAAMQHAAAINGPAAAAAAARAAVVEKAARSAGAVASRPAEESGALAAAAAAATRAAAARVHTLQPCQVELSIEGTEAGLAAEVSLELSEGTASEPGRGCEPTAAGATVHCGKKPAEPLTATLRVRGAVVEVLVLEVQGGSGPLPYGEAAPTNHLSISDGIKRQRVVAVDAASSPPLALEASIGRGWRAALKVQ